MNLNNTYEEKERIEREFLKLIIPILYKESEYEIRPTPIGSKSSYDAVIFILDPQARSIIKRVLIEVKCRDIHYETLMLEKPKLQTLQKKCEEFDAEMQYISITPQGTYCFDLTELSKTKLKWVKEWHNISTTHLQLGTKLKTITYLNCSDAFKIDGIKSTMKDLFIKEEVIIKPKEVIKIQRGFDI